MLKTILSFKRKLLVLHCPSVIVFFGILPLQFYSSLCIVLSNFCYNPRIIDGSPEVTIISCDHFIQLNFALYPRGVLVWYWYHCSVVRFQRWGYILQWYLKKLNLVAQPCSAGWWTRSRGRWKRSVGRNTALASSWMCSRNLAWYRQQEEHTEPPPKRKSVVFME